MRRSSPILNGRIAALRFGRVTICFSKKFFTPTPHDAIAAVKFSIEDATDANKAGKQLLNVEDWGHAADAFSRSLIVLNRSDSAKPLAAVFNNVTTCALRSGQTSEGCIFCHRCPDSCMDCDKYRCGVRGLKIIDST